MLVLLKLISITSILVLGCTIATQPGMILYFIREWAKHKQEKGLKGLEPLLLCHWCMPSVWSFLGYLFGFATGIIAEYKMELLFMYPLVICGSSIVVGVTWSIYELISSATQFYKNLNDEIENNENDEINAN